eukprot:1893290-Lingulodinium_polyedra.AAC.1
MRGSGRLAWGPCRWRRGACRGASPWCSTARSPTTSTSCSAAGEEFNRGAQLLSAVQLGLP